MQVKGDFSIGTTAVDYTLAGTVNLNGATRTITGFNNQNQIHFTKAITNGGLTLTTSLSGTGNYVAFLFGANDVNTYTGLTTIQNGAFLVLQGSTANGAIQGDVLIQGNGVVDYLGGDGNNPFSSEQIANTSSVTVNSDGNTANGTQFAGLDLFNAQGTETIKNLNGTGTVFVANSTLAVSGGNFSGSISDGSHTDGGGNRLIGGGLTKYGTDTLTLSGVNSYTGATTISDGTLALTGAGLLGNQTAVSLTAATSIFDISGMTSASDTIGSLTGVAGSSVVLGDRNLTAGNNNTGTTFAGVLSGTGGSFTKVGTGTMSLTGVNTYTGATAVNGGTLSIDLSTNATALSSSSALVLGGGTFLVTDTTATDRLQKMNGLTVNAGSSSIVINNTTGGTTTLDLRGDSVTQGITHNAGGSVDFRSASGAGAFSTTDIVKTDQQNDASGILGAYATVNGGADFAANADDGTDRIVAYTGYTNIAARGPGSVILIPADPNANVRISTPGTAGPITLASTTTIINTLSQNVGTAAVVDLAGETLKVGATGGIFITPSGASLTIGTAPNSGTLTSGGTSAVGNGELILGNFNTSAASVLTINSSITNNGGVGVVDLLKTGDGIVVLAGHNSYRGATVIGAGTLALTGIGTITETSAVSLTGTTSTLDISGISGSNTTIGSLDGVLGSKVVLGAKGLTAGGNNNSTTFGGVISGTGGSFTKVGTGTMILTGMNTYDGLTTVDGGALVLNTTGGNAIAGNVLITSGSSRAPAVQSDCGFEDGDRGWRLIPPWREFRNGRRGDAANGIHRREYRRAVQRNDVRCSIRHDHREFEQHQRFGGTDENDHGHGHPRRAEHLSRADQCAGGRAHSRWDDQLRHEWGERDQWQRVRHDGERRRGHGRWRERGDGY